MKQNRANETEAGQVCNTGTNKAKYTKLDKKNMKKSNGAVYIVSQFTSAV